MPPIGIFGRVRAVDWGWGSVGAGLTLSREHDSYDETIGSHDISWWWNPAYRATASLGVEVYTDGLSLRLEGGLGYLLNTPQCSDFVASPESLVAGPCDSPRFSATVRDESSHGRVIPSLTATIGYRLPWPGHAAEVAPVSYGYKDPDRAGRLSRWSTLGAAAAGAVLVAAGIATNDGKLGTAGGGVMALGLAYGPSVGYVYAGEPIRGLGMGTLRALGLVVGTFAIGAGITPYDSDHPSSPDHPAPMALGACLIAASIASTIYDVVRAPNAARRTNESNALVDVALVPTVGATTSSPAGAALVGRF
jgi:hypothetical protein